MTGQQQDTEAEFPWQPSIDGIPEARSLEPNQRHSTPLTFASKAAWYTASPSAIKTDEEGWRGRKDRWVK